MTTYINIFMDFKIHILLFYGITCIMFDMRTIFVENNKKKQTIVTYLKGVYPNLSTSFLFKALRNKDIRLNGIKVSQDQTIFQNDRLDIYIIDEILFHLPKELEIVYEDEHIFVIHKPQGILSNIEEIDEKRNRKIGGAEPTIEDLVLQHNPHYKLCHRLDRNTGGLLIFAKTDLAFQELWKAFQFGLIHKEYTAYVSNSHFSKDHEILENYLVKNKLGFSKIYSIPVKNSQKIITEYHVIRKNPIQNFAILKVIIHTGKTHQIRAQLAQIDHPIIGDSKYGKNEINQTFKVYQQLLFAIRYQFHLEKNSPLFYLNQITITLDSKYYENKI